MPRLAILLYPSGNAGDGLLEGRPVAGGILRSAPRVKPELWALGKELRELLEGDIKVVLDIANDSHLMEDLPWIAESIQLRNIYTDPLNVLQAELLHRSRLAEEEGKEPDPRVEQALMVTIAGVAAGMRNTG